MFSSLQIPYQIWSLCAKSINAGLGITALTAPFSAKKPARAGTVLVWYDYENTTNIRDFAHPERCWLEKAIWLLAPGAV
jgi:hypothetical protein